MIEDRLIIVDYADEMKKSYIDYAMSVIIARALPDVRDGLKPVQRRILYAMSELGLVPKYDEVKKKYELKPFRKSARIVGDTMGKYHPHGDSSIYEALVNMAQVFKMMEPLIEGEGNYGSIDGDSPAQMRYTEARLNQIINYLLTDIEKGVVDFVDNFDGSLKQPSVLPAKYPNLLVNGTDGIAVGMATKIPSHNLKEVIDAVLAYMANENISFEELLNYLPAPDFVTGGTISNKSEMLELYKTGRGRVKIRGNVIIEKGQQGRVSVIIKEVPYTYTGNVNKLVSEIADLAKDNKLPELYDFKNQSDMDGLHIVLELKKGSNPEAFLNKLYKKTGLESNFNVEMRAIVDGKPQVLNLRDFIFEFLKFQDEIYTKKFEFLLDKTERRLESVEGLLKAMDVLDIIIEAIRGSKSVPMVKECLISGKTEGINFKTKSYQKIASKFDFTELQADAILNLQLIRLMGLEIEKLAEEKEKLIKKVEEYQKYLRSKKSLRTVIKKELQEIQSQYGKPRKTMIEDIAEITIEEVDVIEELYVLVDKFNYIKVIDQASYARINNGTLNDYKYVFECLSTENIVLFSDMGNSYTIKISEIPKSKMSDRGTPLSVLVKTKNEEFLFVNIVEKNIDEKMLFITDDGNAKIVPMSMYVTNRKKISAITLDEKEKVNYVNTIKDNVHLCLYSKEKQGAKLSISEIPEKNRNTKGSPLVQLDNDKIVACEIFKEKPHNLLFKGTNINFDSMNTQKRYRKMKKM